jgi:hypothetical protein
MGHNEIGRENVATSYNESIAKNIRGKIASLTIDLATNVANTEAYIKVLKDIEYLEEQYERYSFKDRNAATYKVFAWTILLKLFSISNEKEIIITNAFRTIVIDIGKNSSFKVEMSSK